MGFGVITYVLWGLFPAYFPLLAPADPVEIIAHRITWTAVFMAILITFQRSWGAVLQGIRHYRWRIAVAALLIAINWLVYVMAVTAGHVADAALGYFINPLVSIALGMLFFQERLRRLQQVAVAVAAVAVGWLTITQGALPMIPLALALSFGFYGVLKKRIALPATISLTAESLLLLPMAVAYFVWLHQQGTGTFFDHGAGHAGLLMTTGLVTAIPLLTFATAAHRVTLGTLGMLQYITPTMQFLWAVFVVQESIPAARWIGFSFIWLAVGLYLLDLYRQRHPKPQPETHNLDSPAPRTDPK